MQKPEESLRLDKRQLLTLFLTELDELISRFVELSMNMDSSNKQDLQPILRSLSTTRTLLAEQLRLEQRMLPGGVS
jgi:hypothetical protein